MILFLVIRRFEQNSSFKLYPTTLHSTVCGVVMCKVALYFEGISSPSFTESDNFGQTCIIFLQLRIIFNHLITIHMRRLILNTIPGPLALRLTHSIPSIHFLLKLLSTLHQIMMQTYPLPRNGRPECKMLNRISVLTHCPGPGTKIEFVWVDGTTGVTGLYDGLYVDVWGRVIIGVGIVGDASHECFSSRFWTFQKA